MNVALIIVSSFLLLENIILAIMFLIRKVKHKATIKRNKQIRIEFNSALVNMRRLENLIKETAREDGNEAN